MGKGPHLQAGEVRVRVLKAEPPQAEPFIGTLQVTLELRCREEGSPVQKLRPTLGRDDDEAPERGRDRSRLTKRLLPHTR